MKLIKTLLISALSLFILLTMSTASFSESVPYPEPEISKAVKIVIVFEYGYLLVYYKTDKNSSQPWDYCTERLIYPDATVSVYPWGYGIDLNGDGRIDGDSEMWVDEVVDGLNGNEMTYRDWLEKEIKMQM